MVACEEVPSVVNGVMVSTVLSGCELLKSTNEVVLLTGDTVVDVTLYGDVESDLKRGRGFFVVLNDSSGDSSVTLVGTVFSSVFNKGDFSVPGVGVSVDKVTPSSWYGNVVGTLVVVILLVVI